MQEDIRDIPYLNQEDVLKLNFIREPGAYVYRRHYRQGLRSHILEVLSLEDVENEKNGVIIDGAKWYPRAEPLKMLRLFRARFRSLQEAQEEVERVKMIESYLGPENFAKSEEFLVDYEMNGSHDILLCGLQEYVKGAILDPWDRLDDGHLISILRRISFETFEDAEEIGDQWVSEVRLKALDFITKTKKMILETNHVPDLAGIGNLLLTREGDIKLVDINNISNVTFDPDIRIDDRGYPVCDKSIESLSLLEEGLLQRPLPQDDVIYETYLEPGRMEEVNALEKEFLQALERDTADNDISPS
ncbi:MAG: hypothetical protein JSV47_09850 [Deltaproteobacteria bacterium]|nr:MAG: hypothetical protein JSV47_09850 [Deltaproteobacteria bacterium]